MYRNDRYNLGRLRYRQREPAPQKNMDDTGKTIRESVQLLINILTALAAVFVFVRYDSVRKDLDNRAGEIDLVKKDLDVRLSKIAESIQGTDLEKGQIELQGLTGRKIAVEKHLRVRKMAAANLYKVDLDYSFTNKAGVPMEIRGVVAEIYVGTVPAVHGAFAEVNDPFHPGVVLWTPVIKKAWVIDGDTRTTLPAIDPNAAKPVPAEKGRGGTGLLNSGEVSSGGLAVMGTTSEYSVLGAYVSAYTKLPKDPQESGWFTFLVDDVQALMESAVSRPSAQ